MTAGGTLAIFESLTGGEVIMISVFALVVLGPERLPEVARSAAEWITKLKQLTTNLQGEMQEVMDDPAMQPIREVGEFVAQPRKKLSEIVASAEQDSVAAASDRLASTSDEPELDPDPDPEPEPVADPAEPDASDTAGATANERQSASPDSPGDELEAPDVDSTSDNVEEPAE